MAFAQSLLIEGESVRPLPPPRNASGNRACAGACTRCAPGRKAATVGAAAKALTENASELQLLSTTASGTSRRIARARGMRRRHGPGAES